MEKEKKVTTGTDREKLGRELFPPIDRLMLPQRLRSERLREEVISDIQKSPQMYGFYSELGEKDQEMLMEFFMGNRGLNALYDPFFKILMTPQRLENLLKQIMGQQVEIIKVLPTETIRKSEEGSVMIMDMVVKLADGSYVDLEIQRITVEFPFERAVCYASDMVVRQYEQLKMEQKRAAREWKTWKKRRDEAESLKLRGFSVGEEEPEPAVKFNYENLRPVYVIVLMNSSADKYSVFREQYIHRTPDEVVFDTGLKERAIQKFIFISLDIFRGMFNNRDKSKKMTELEAWLCFLASSKPDDITQLVQEYPQFTEMYMEINQFRLRPEEMMTMMTEAIKMLDEGDAKMQIERLHEKVEKLQSEAEALMNEKAAMENANKELTDTNKELADTNKELTDTNKELTDTNKELIDTNKELAEANEALKKRIAELESGQG
ncbi:MAG: PD-(D/E)XK nuclease family transposase [Lachnospiraceae bacterium]|nr:PD-(D/E)XK nuclease family transposase [Lachnospiraceae bacterium]